MSFKNFYCSIRLPDNLKQPSTIAQLYLVESIPCTFPLDETNRIIAKNLRGEELKAKVAEPLK